MQVARAQDCARDIIQCFMASVLQNNESHCIGEKILFNWLLRIFPKNTTSNLRLISFNPDIFVFIMQCPSFLQRFVEWFEHFKRDYLR